ncbi:hypothetical protein [Sulfitobacter delicatus]|uniref:Uncharacterized protein n=1 Tax=Sulfitobacter delicatus TaxID=218672 RepID=A0A1G7P5D7_9RHOB|nr:hypothetical protein [Sulfitobacter delicatus]SDF81454.1 hypothetical protein SAMN04489759_103227 [Sulfitobacter delicatus]
MAISTTTFEERLNRIETRAAKADKAHRRRRRAQPRPGRLIGFVAAGMLIGGTAFAWDGTTPPYEWALPSLEWAMALLR